MPLQNQFIEAETMETKVNLPSDSNMTLVQDELREEMKMEAKANIRRAQAHGGKAKRKLTVCTLPPLPLPPHLCTFPALQKTDSGP